MSRWRRQWSRRNRDKTLLKEMEGVMLSVHGMYNLSDLWKSLFGSNETKAPAANANIKADTSSYTEAPAEKGSALGWFACSVLTGRSFSHGASYDWNTSECTPHGSVVRMPRGM